MMLKDIMTRDVEVVSPESSLSEVAEKMKRFDTGVLPVCDGRRVRGMITDRDIVVRGIAERRDITTMRASEIMTPEVVYCYENDSVKHASKLMQDRQIRRVIVVDREKNLVGIVSIGDLALESGKNRVAGETLSEISKPWSSSNDSSHHSRSGKSLLGAGAGVGSLAFAASLVGAGYWFLQQNPEVKTWINDFFGSGESKDRSNVA